jgi:hypothetical protein
MYGCDSVCILALGGDSGYHGGRYYDRFFITQFQSVSFMNVTGEISSLKYSARIAAAHTMLAIEGNAPFPSGGQAEHLTGKMFISLAQKT